MRLKMENFFPDAAMSPKTIIIVLGMLLVGFVFWAGHTIGSNSAVAQAEPVEHTCDTIVHILNDVLETEFDASQLLGCDTRILRNEDDTLLCDLLDGNRVAHCFTEEHHVAISGGIVIIGPSTPVGFACSSFNSASHPLVRNICRIH